MYSHRFALVIGIDAYTSLPRLESAVIGATEIARRLGYYDYEVSPLYNSAASKDAVLQSLSHFQGIVGPQDAFIFYYAGHGSKEVTKHGRVISYLELLASKAGETTKFKTRDLLDELEKLDALHILAMFDACFTGISLLTFRGGIAPKVLRDRLSEKAFQILAAGETLVSDRSGEGNEHSPFTDAVLRGLRGEAFENSLLTATILGEYVANHVEFATEGREKPVFGHLTSANGDLVFSPQSYQNEDEQPVDVTASKIEALAEINKAATRVLEMRGRLVEAAGHVGGKKASETEQPDFVDVLISLLSDESDRVVLDAMRTLSKLGLVDRVPGLLYSIGCIAAQHSGDVMLEEALTRIIVPRVTAETLEQIKPLIDVLRNTATSISDTRNRLAWQLESSILSVEVARLAQEGAIGALEDLQAQIDSKVKHGPEDPRTALIEQIDNAIEYIRLTEQEKL